MKSKPRSPKPRSRAAARRKTTGRPAAQKTSPAARQTTRKAASTKRPAAPPRTQSARPPHLVRPTVVPDRWKWHYQALSTLRDRFISDCQERLRDAAQPIEPHSMSMADSATDDFDHSLALTFLASGQLALAEVEAALARIEAGTYGCCEESGKPIPAARLRAVPWTRYRTEVEARHEQKNGSGKTPRLNPPGPMD